MHVLAQLEAVEDGGLAGGVQAQHQDASVRWVGLVGGWALQGEMNEWASWPLRTCPLCPKGLPRPPCLLTGSAPFSSLSRPGALARARLWVGVWVNE